MRTIHVFGSINLDFTFHIPRLPEQGETLMSDDFHTSPGGKGANQAVAAARQDVQTVMLGALGSDGPSEKLREALADSGIDVSHVQRLKNEHAGVAAILIEGNDNRIVITPGANHKVAEEPLLHALREAKAGDILLSQLEVPLPSIRKVFAEAKHRGLYTILNAAPAAKLPASLYADIDLLALNEAEANHLLAGRPEAAKSAEDMASRLLHNGAQAVLITLGGKGSLFMDAGRTYRVPAYAVKTVDTTAAGDAFLGTLAARLADSEKMQTALGYASAAAAVTVSRAGAQKAIPFRKEVERFMKTTQEESS